MNLIRQTLRRVLPWIGQVKPEPILVDPAVTLRKKMNDLQDEYMHLQQKTKRNKIELDRIKEIERLYPAVKLELNSLMIKVR